MTRTQLLLSEARLQTRIFFRTTVAAFFTLVLPLMFLVMINFFVPDEPNATISASQYITPALAVFGMITATFTNLASPRRGFRRASSSGPRWLRSSRSSCPPCSW